MSILLHAGVQRRGAIELWRSSVLRRSSRITDRCGLVSASCRLKCAGVVDFLASEGADLVGGDFGHCNGPPIKGREFDLEAVAAFIDVNDRSHITHGKPMLGKVSG
jgi:hypothetical protein